MNKPTALIMLMIATLAIVGCTTTQTEDDKSTMTFTTYGGFTIVTEARQVLTVTPNIIEYTIYSGDGPVTWQTERTIDKATYDKLLSTFNDNGFWKFKDEYNPDVIVTDVGTAELSMTKGNRQKTVKIQPYIHDTLPKEVIAVLSAMQELTNQLYEINEDEAKHIAEDYIKKAPTYAFDGTDLQFQQYNTREPYPSPHRLTYTFKSSHGGYGDRTDKMVTQVITTHTISITITNREVTSAIIDNIWDEMTQEIIGGYE